MVGDLPKKTNKVLKEIKGESARPDEDLRQYRLTNENVRNISFYVLREVHNTITRKVSAAGRSAAFIEIWRNGKFDKILSD